MNVTKYCIKKDFSEFMRRYKWLICSLVVFFCGLLTLFVSWAMPIMNQALSGFVDAGMGESLSAFDELSKMFPDNVRGSLAAFLSMVMVYYGLTAVLVTVGAIPKEIRKGKWIAPINSGIRIRQLLVSKIVVWSSLTGFISVIGYVVYYMIAGMIFENDLSLCSMLWFALWLWWSVFFVTAETMALSGVCGNKIVPLITVLPCIIAVADVLSMFEIGKYFPTYILTYVTVLESSEPWTVVIIPFLEGVIGLALTIMWAQKRAKKIRIGK